ncbi:MAG: sugar transferase [Chthoniobacterales bacterium]
MISQREKSIYLSFSVAQITLVSVLFGLFYLINDQIRLTWLSAPSGYLQILIVLLLSLIAEAASRPSAMRVSTGRLQVRAARSLARRQSLCLAGGFGIFLALTRDTNISRLFLIGIVVAAYPLFLYSNRHGRRWFHRTFPSSASSDKVSTLVLGSAEWCESLCDRLEDFSVYFDTQEALVFSKDDDIDRITSAVVSRKPDLLVLPSNEFPYEVVAHLLAVGDRRGFRCWIPVEMSRRHGRRFELQDVGGLSVLSPPTLPLAGAYNRAVKRAFDLAVSFLVIPFILLPLMCIVALIQRRSSPGSLFFRQERVGENGKIFQILKFRTMQEANDNEARQASANDRRVYPGGRWLRRLSIDEFPQFFNVLRGEMSVIGPRPHMIEHEREFEKFHELYGSRRYVKPGVSGLAQVAGFRGEVKDARDIRGRARYDLFYVKHWCLGLDIRLALQTFLQVASPPEKAY